MFWYYYLVIFIINFTHSQYIYQSLSVLSDPGTRYSPANLPAQFISSVFVSSWKLCAIECNKNTFCRVFDYGAMQPKQCLLFEGDVGKLGTVISSSMPDSIVGAVQMTPSLFTQYGQPCSSVCLESRYLVCNKNSVCQCMPHTYWDGSVAMCLAQMTMSGAPCDPSMDMCREDLNLTCSPMNQCSDSTTPPASISSPEIIADGSTVIEGSSSTGLGYPMGITVYDDNGDESLIAIDSSKNVVIHLATIHSPEKTISVLASSWTGGDSFNLPSYLFLDTNHQNDLYVSDPGNERVLLLSSMQIVDPLPQVVAGITAAGSSTPDSFVIPYGIAVDSQKNLYVVDHYNHRVMLWAENASSGILIAGTGVTGSGAEDLRYPIGLFLDEANSLLYVADRDNHRIQLFNLTGSPPYIGVTAAGGNGNGSNQNQLNQPTDVWVSKETGAIYIADTSNHRIQCWNPGATNGHTIAGDPNGIAGSDITKLNSPSGLTINKNETRMYVTDTANARILQFNLT